MIKIIKVTGKSLSPFFLPGEYALVWHAPRRFSNLSQGDIVVFNHDDYGLLIKKIVHNYPDMKYIVVEGIHPDSLSLEKIGRIPYANIIGKVLRRIHLQTL